MAATRFVVLGLAAARSPWFSAVAQWSDSGSAPVEFLKCVSVIELRAHLGSGRAFSAVLVDGGLPAADRDLFDAARVAGCAVIVVDDLRVTRDWTALGASVVINPVFGRKDLVDILTAHASPVRRGEVSLGIDDAFRHPSERGVVALVCGSGGTGASTVAIALAQGLADRAAGTGEVLLADFALHAEQAMLHDTRDVVPGIQELVDAHRAAHPTADEVRRMTFDVHVRGYELLLGLRRARNWTALRPRALTAAFDTLTRVWTTVVVDADSDLEDEDDGGSADVEERHLLARTAAANADVVLAVGGPGMKGVHALVRVINELLDHDVPGDRIIPVVNRSPKAARARAELAEAVATLLGERVEHDVMATAIHLPERHVDEDLRDGVRLPGALTAPVTGAFDAIIARSGRRSSDREPRPVKVGSLGSWSAPPGAAAEPA